VHALSTRGGQVAVATAAVLVLVIALAAGGAFDGCRGKGGKVGRPSAAVSSSPHGGVAYATAKVLATSVGKRPADTWGEIHAREFITGAFQQYGYFPLLDEFIATSGGRRIHSANIIALKEGDSAKRLVVGAHYDSSVTGGQGYTDNATGIGLLLEMAGRIKNMPTPYTIVFVAFGAEEDGSLGAQDYVRSMSEVERRATIGMIDLDAPAGGDELSVASRSGGATWLRDDALSAADSLGIPLVTSPETPVREAGTVLAPADDLPFANADIATAIFSAVSWKASKGRHVAQTADGPPIWHTPRDTVKYVDTRYPKRVRTQLRDMSLLLETLLTSELGRRP
jgi:alkaline phosphatase isozyme conversion protein